MENSVTVKQENPRTIKGWLASDSLKNQIAAALPRHMTADRMIRVGLNALMRTPKLADCTPESVIGCMLNLSALGLEPDGRRAHLIPYGNSCTLIVDYKGLVELAKRSGEIGSIHADVVCENDLFDYDTGVVKQHRIDFKKPRGQMYAAYCIIKFKEADADPKCEVMTKEEVDGIRKRSKASGSGPWVTDYNEMAKKTVFRRASKWITLSPEVADALDKDGDVIDVQSFTEPTPRVTSEPATVEEPQKPEPEKKPRTKPKLEPEIIAKSAPVDDEAANLEAARSMAEEDEIKSNREFAKVRDMALAKMPINDIEAACKQPTHEDAHPLGPMSSDLKLLLSKLADEGLSEGDLILWGKSIGTLDESSTDARELNTRHVLTALKPASFKSIVAQIKMAKKPSM